jgi:hypothetical protein
MAKHVDSTTWPEKVRGAAVSLCERIDDFATIIMGIQTDISKASLVALLTTAAACSGSVSIPSTGGGSTGGKAGEGGAGGNGTMCSPANCEGTCDENDNCATGKVLWSKSSHGDLALAMAIDVGDSGIVVVGSHQGTTQFDDVTLTTGTSTEAGFVVKYDDDGNVLWARQVGEGQFNAAYDVAVDGQTGITVVGYQDGDSFWQIFDENGDNVAGNALTAVGGTVSAQNVAIGQDGAPIITGQFSGTLSHNGAAITAQGVDGFVIKIGTNGWIKSISGEETEDPRGLAVDQSGNIYVGGYFNGTLNAIQGNIPAIGGFDAFIRIMNPQGDTLIDKAYGGPNAQSGSGIAIDNNGNVVVITQSDGPGQIDGTDILEGATLSQLNQNGDHLWSTRFGNAAYNVATDPNNNIIGTGISTGGSTIGDSASMLFQKSTPNGQVLWAHELHSGGSGFVAGQDAKAWGGSVYVVGNFQGVVVVDGKTHYSLGESEALIVAMDE